MSRTTNGSQIDISVVHLKVPVTPPAPSKRKSKHPQQAPDSPHVSLELADDRCRIWDNSSYAGDSYDLSYTTAEARDRWSRGYRDLPSIPFFDAVYRHVVNQCAANRGNPLGAFLAHTVDAMEKGIAERDGSQVYFARAGDRIKIGWSRRVGARIAQLQTGSPEPVTLAATTTGGRAQERKLHERFAHLRVAGEWFQAGQELLDHIRSITGEWALPTAANDLSDDEDRRVVVAANAFRQARDGRPSDPWDWQPCTQDDVDRARALVATLTPATANPQETP